MMYCPECGRQDMVLNEKSFNIDCMDCGCSWKIEKK